MRVERDRAAAAEIICLDIPSLAGVYSRTPKLNSGGIVCGLHKTWINMMHNGYNEYMVGLH